jgi:tetratricopeptide (TPR) repeat protein
MRKLVFLFIGVVFVAAGLIAQAPVSPLSEGVKLLNYEKNKSALVFFKDALDKNPTDGETVFWYGQALLAQNYNGIPTPEAIKITKEVFQAALQSKGNDPWLLIGMSHVQLLEGADNNAVKQNLEVAITSSLNTKGKYKGKPNQDIINAIGRVFAELPIRIGDHHYAVDKLKETISAYDLVSPSLHINLGINYLKLGGEYGGEAVTAFQNAINVDPKSAYAYYRIGKIYQTQSNKESVEEYYRKAIEADPVIAPVYFALYDFYKDKNSSMAKSNLDLFLTHADKDPLFEYYSADYLYRSGQFDQSLEKAKAMEAAGNLTVFPTLAVLLAKNYDHKGDSVLAKSYIEPYINNTPTDKIVSTDYELAIKILSRFSGNQSILAALLEKAVTADTSKDNKLKYYKLGADMFEKATMYSEALKWYTSLTTLKGSKAEFDYYKLASLALNAKNGQVTMEVAKQYITAFPEKAQGYNFNTKGAALIDTANNQGILFEAVNFQNQFLLKDSVKYKQALINNYYTLIGYYNETKGYDNAVLMCDKVLELVPNDPTTLQAKAQFVKNAEILKKMQAGKAAKAAAAPDTTEPKKN